MFTCGTIYSLFMGTQYIGRSTFNMCFSVCTFLFDLLTTIFAVFYAISNTHNAAQTSWISSYVANKSIQLYFNFPESNPEELHKVVEQGHCSCRPTTVWLIRNSIILFETYLLQQNTCPKFPDLNDAFHWPCCLLCSYVLVGEGNKW